LNSSKITWKDDKVALAFNVKELILTISGLSALEKNGWRKHSKELDPVLLLKGQLQRVVNAKELVYSEEEIQQELKNIRGDVCLDCP
jgi:hypothetical protein